MIKVNVVSLDACIILFSIYSMITKCTSLFIMLGYKFLLMHVLVKYTINIYIYNLHRKLEFWHNCFLINMYTCLWPLSTICDATAFELPSHNFINMKNEKLIKQLNSYYTTELSLCLSCLWRWQKFHPLVYISLK